MFVPVLPFLLFLFFVLIVLSSNRALEASRKIVLLVFCVSFEAAAQTAVLTQCNDNSSDGLNNAETILTTSNVNVTQFGKLFSLPVDGQVYGQPLYVPHLGMARSTMC